MKGIIKKIDQINFGLMSPEQIREMSVVKIERPDTYDEDGYPIEGGLMDSRMGVIDPSLKCRTCGEKGGECQGHFGMIELARPVIHVGFGDDIYKILRSTCSECGRVLLDEEEIDEYKERILEHFYEDESAEETIKEIYKICKERKTYDICPHCGAEQEDIKIVKPIDIIEVRRQYDEFGEPVTDTDGNPVTEDYDLTASEVREKLQRIPDEDAYVLGVNPEVARPEWMVLTVLPVPPVTMRPSITLDTGERSEDDLTHKLVDILRINQRLIENMDAGAPQLIVEDLWKLLQYHVTTYFDNEADGIPPARHRSGRPLETLMQRLKGKEGRFRSNLTGKRVNFSARTVITPDPNISINEAGVPEMIAKEVTVPAYVNEWNIDELREAIFNGPNVHPGANYVKKFINGHEMKVRVLEDNRELVAENLEYGDIVMRHLRDGDIVLFNRQPSLHRMSIMAHEVRVLPYKTFRLNLCVCPPYNADFDGDEMNIHVLQTDESRAEAKSLMRVQEHILSPRFGGPIIGAIHDHISGAYLLTREEYKVPEDEAFQMIRKAHLLDNPYVDKRYLRRKNRDWTGKEIFSLLLPDDLNMVYKAEICRKCEECQMEYCPYDAFVLIKDGQLIYGVIDEAAFGSFSGKILDTIVKEYGPSRAKEFLDRSTDLVIDAITKIGISTSLNDFEIPEEAIEVIDAHLEKAEETVDKFISDYEMGLIIPEPGRSAEETLEMRIVQVLGEARDTAGEIAEGYLTMGKESNDESYDYIKATECQPLIMARTGARSSMLNIAQVSACVGQQSVRGGRITRGYNARPLPHFRKHELGAKAKGFVHSSYKEGLDPTEFFFHAMGGREGLVDTAIRTAQSGYMQRRLVNALEDLNVRSDGLVTDSRARVIQSVFGEDGIDPMKSDFGHIVNLDRIIDEMRIESVDSYSDKRTNYQSPYSNTFYSRNSKSYNYNTNRSFAADSKPKTSSVLLEKIESYKNVYQTVEDELASKLNEYGQYKSSVDEYIKNAQNLNDMISSSPIDVHENIKNRANTLSSDLEKIYLNLESILYRINECSNLLNHCKPKDYNFSNVDEINEELLKLNAVLYSSQSFFLSHLKIRIDNTFSLYQDLKKEFERDLLINEISQYKDYFSNVLEKMDIEREKVNDFENQWNELIKNIKFDNYFSLVYNNEINDLYNNLNSIKEEYDLFIKDMNDLKNKLTNFMHSSNYFNSLYELKMEIDDINNLIKNLSSYQDRLIKNFENQSVLYQNLIFNELDFKKQYLELYELNINVTYLDKDILDNITRFKEYIKTNDFILSDEDIEIIKNKIMIDIINNQVTQDLDFKSLFNIYSKELKKSVNELIDKDDDLVGLGLSLDDFDEKSLFYFSKFKEFAESIVFKFKAVSNDLSDEDTSIINKKIILDILDKKLIQTNFNEIYDDYIKRYHDGEFKDTFSSSSDKWFEENYKELIDLGFTSKDVDEEILKNYNLFNEYKLSPVFNLKTLSLSLSDDDMENITKNIINDIVNKELVGDLNFDSIYTNYSNKYKAEKRLEGINWDEILKNIDLGLYSDETIEYCKRNVTIELRESKISPNMIKSRFKFYINRKNEIDQKLEYLEDLKNNPNEPQNKQFLTKEELDDIYLLVANKIRKENPTSVNTILTNEINIIIRMNQSKARRKFERYYKDRDNFLHITGLAFTQADLLISRIEYAINQNVLKAEDIDEEYIRQAAIKLKNDMDYVDRNY